MTILQCFNFSKKSTTPIGLRIPRRIPDSHNTTTYQNVFTCARHSAKQCAYTVLSNFIATPWGRHCFYLQMRKLSVRDIKQLAQGYTAIKGVEMRFEPRWDSVSPLDIIGCHPSGIRWYLSYKWQSVERESVALRK